jgi:hypothetical protein
VLVSGLSWYLGSRLEPFKALADENQSEIASCITVEPKFWQLLREKEPFEVVDGVVVRRGMRQDDNRLSAERRVDHREYAIENSASIHFNESDMIVNPLIVDHI